MTQSSPAVACDDIIMTIYIYERQLLLLMSD